MNSVEDHIAVAPSFMFRGIEQAMDFQDVLQTIDITSIICTINITLYCTRDILAYLLQTYSALNKKGISKMCI